MIESLIYSGLVPKPLGLKLNPVWWFKNDGEPDPPADYKPDKPQWLRVLFWYLRNPLVNFCDYVIGVEDRDHIAYGQVPIDITDWLDAGETGWKFGVLKVNLLVWLPYVSYTGTHVLWHFGWYAGGRFQIKFNLLGFGESPI